MRLPAGATGFGAPDGLASPDEVRSFLTACHDLARQTGGRVTAARQPGVTPSFHTVVISYDHERVAVLRHARLALITFAREPDPGATLVAVFLDRPVLADILRQTTDCQILSAADLNAPLSGADLSDLSGADYKEIRYWKPATPGELLFNHWD